MSQLPEDDAAAVYGIISGAAEDSVDLFSGDRQGVTEQIAAFGPTLDHMFSAIADATNFPLFTAYRLVYLFTNPDWEGTCRWTTQSSEMTFFTVEVVKTDAACNAPDRTLLADGELSNSGELKRRKTRSLRMCAELCTANMGSLFFGSRCKRIMQGVSGPVD